MAIKLYYDLEKVLEEELGVEPSPEVTELFHRIFNVKGNIAVDNGSWNLPFTEGQRKFIVSASALPVQEMAASPVCCHRRRRRRGKIRPFGKDQADGKGYQMVSLYAACYKDESEFSSVPGMIFSGKSSSAWKAGFWNGTLRMMKEEN